MTDMEQNAINKLSSVLISLIQGGKLFSTLVGNLVVIQHEMKIKTRHGIAPRIQTQMSATLHVCLGMIKAKLPLLGAIAINCYKNKRYMLKPTRNLR
ncbi:MAG: hypothetical protein WBG18_23510, partial [Xanthobacteraceae bacterium]